MSKTTDAERTLKRFAFQAMQETSGQAALAVLMRLLEKHGVRELPGNRGPWVRLFMRGDEGMAWCAAAALEAAKAVALPPAHKGYWPNRSVRAWVRNSKAGGQFIGRAVVPEPGDVVFWRGRRGSDAGAGNHADVVVGVHDTLRSGPTLELIGGNVSNSICSRLKPHRDPAILGYHRWVEARS